MGKWFARIDDIEAGRNKLCFARYGMIESEGGQFRQIQLRPWPKLVSGAGAHWIGGATHSLKRRDRVRFWYSQPLGHSNFLILSYAVSEMGATTLTLRSAFHVLDRIAVFKRSDAIMCEASNPRLNDRIMKFAGFERHMLNSRRRHYIRRFYGNYPGNPNGDSCHQLTLPVPSVTSVIEIPLTIPEFSPPREISGMR